MVKLLSTGGLLVAEASQDTVLEKLDPERRAAVVMALVGLGLLGVLLVVVTMLAGRWARQERPSRSTRLCNLTTGSDRYDTRLPGADIRRGETVVGDDGSEETKA